MYKNCLNENPSANKPSNNVKNVSGSSIKNGLSGKESSALSIDVASAEATFKQGTPSSRSLASSTAAFASNQLIAAANIARSLQQQKQQLSLSNRTIADSECNPRGSVSAGANSKANLPFSTLPKSTSSATYASLMQEAARSSSIIQLFKDTAKKQNSRSSSKEKLNDSVDSQSLALKALDMIATQVKYLLRI